MRDRIFINWKFGVTVTATLFVFTGFTVFPVEKTAPQVRFLSPASGWSASKVVTVEGEVFGSYGMEEVEFYLNGVGRNVAIQNGRFSQSIVLGAGANYIKVVAKNQYGVSSDSLRLVTENSNIDMMVILFWDTNHTDVDLWVTDPNAERVYYAHKRSRIGGTLDIDITTGYGPETFTLMKAIPGEYSVQAQYFGGTTPTVARVVVYLYPGTPREKKYTFPAFLYKSGEGITIGKFNVQ